MLTSDVNIARMDVSISPTLKWVEVNTGLIPSAEVTSFDGNGVTSVVHNPFATTLQFRVYAVGYDASGRIVGGKELVPTTVPAGGSAEVDGLAIITPKDGSGAASSVEVYPHIVRLEDMPAP